MGSQQQFCLRWNNHQTNLLSVFEQLLQSESFVDVTLACEGLSLRAHKVVLSACSPYFQTLFVENPCKHPIVILKDIPYTELKALIEFMYKGEVNVSQDRLSTLLKTAEYLKIKGLSEVSQNHSEGDSETTMTKSKQRLQLHMDGQRASSATPPPQSTHSPPSKRKKLHQRRQSDSVSGTSDLEECEVPHLKGSPEVLESRVELPQNVEDRQICPPIHPQEEVLTLSNSPQDAKEHIMTASPQQEDTSQPSDPGGSGLFQSTGSSTNLLPPLQSAPSTSQPSQDDTLNPNQSKPGIYSIREDMFMSRRSLAYSPQRCRLCHKVISNIYNFRKHMKVHSPVQQRFECSICLRVYNREDNLRWHLRTKHGMQLKRKPRRPSLETAPVQPPPFAGSLAMN